MTIIKRLSSVEDEELHFHNYRVSKMSGTFSKDIGLHKQMIEDVIIGGSLHDVGKEVIPKIILNKPTKLTYEEFNHIKLHPIYSYIILRQMGYNNEICLMVKHHHENYNGTGYPYKLKGKEIPIGARILRIIDMFDALTSDRVYRKKLSCKESLVIMEESKTMFDPIIFYKFKEWVKYAVWE